jgi:hypothetical protein
MVEFGITMNTPADVNRPPKCTELALPCGAPRTFPDFGVLAQATVHVIRYVGLVAEGSRYGNAWNMTIGGREARRAISPGAGCCLRWPSA